MTLDPTLTAGLLTIASALSTVIGAAVTFVARRLVHFLDKLEANNETNTRSLSALVSVVTSQNAEIGELKDALEDRRMSEAVAEVRGVAAAVATGQFAAVTAERAEAPRTGPRPPIPSRPLGSR